MKPSQDTASRDILSFLYSNFHYGSEQRNSYPLHLNPKRDYISTLKHYSKLSEFSGPLFLLLCRADVSTTENSCNCMSCYLSEGSLENS